MRSFDTSPTPISLQLWTMTSAFAGPSPGCRTLNEVGSFLWERLEQGAELENLVGEVVESFETTRAQATTDTATFLRRLVDEAMLVPC